MQVAIESLIPTRQVIATSDEYPSGCINNKRYGSRDGLFFTSGKHHHYNGSVPCCFSLPLILTPSSLPPPVHHLVKSLPFFSLLGLKPGFSLTLCSASYPFTLSPPLFLPIHSSRKSCLLSPINSSFPSSFSV